mmetsp:Transcript_115375/g.288331  ORF Transcript_115375/g.288331 Transcript_115375/m.288331 type:complete len:382 (-) Transcript_115375:31-1176(-)|eukprot:CAMPEP_0115184398 /NCGR_PEP_ID=MMETSP0270-20121206/8942_1 /TAXON_ID=71861 /ORGANISM="Scrippsiella trochoidea, Strain CCMP3099" /LENGTH=381 /DNA_ID=CAMNT_0002597483 /DNA_START=68 /DNA_END=1213 /DNA_ORIENTATION=-
MLLGVELKRFPSTLASFVALLLADLPLTGATLGSTHANAAAAALSPAKIALVPREDMEELASKVRTAWRLVALHNASDSELREASAVVPDFSMIRNTSNMSAELQKIPSGQLLQIPMTGIDTLDLDSIPARFVVCNVHNAGTAIPEYVMAAILSWNVQLPKLDAEFRRCSWQPGGASSCSRPPMHKESKGQTVGIIGYGTIGRGVAQRAAAMGMRVVAVSPEATASAPPPPLAWMGNDTMLPKLMQESDFVVVSCPLLPSTRGLVNESLIGQMKPTGVLINVARGPIVKEDALHDALSKGSIGGAVLDVWWQEFHPDTWPSKFNFGELPNVWMTMHTSYNTAEARHEGMGEVAANLDALALGQPLKNTVRGPAIVSTSFSI